MCIPSIGLILYDSLSLQGDNVSGSWFIVGLCDNAL